METEERPILRQSPRIMYGIASSAGAGGTGVHSLLRFAHPGYSTLLSQMIELEGCSGDWIVEGSWGVAQPVGYRMMSALGAPPAFATNDMSVWRLDELAARLRELVSKIVLANSDYIGLPEVFVMPPVPTVNTTMKVVREKPAVFRFIED
jgi:hypothetical protein